MVLSLFVALTLLYSVISNFQNGSSFDMFNTSPCLDEAVQVASIAVQERLMSIKWLPDAQALLMAFESGDLLQYCIGSDDMVIGVQFYPLALILPSLNQLVILMVVLMHFHGALMKSYSLLPLVRIFSILPTYLLSVGHGNLVSMSHDFSVLNEVTINTPEFGQGNSVVLDFFCYADDDSSFHYDL
jgi:hypothetical protein